MTAGLKTGKFGARMRDGFHNVAARLGWGAGEMWSQGRYGRSAIAHDRGQLEAMYRASWIVGQAVDVVADDMTRAGIAFDAAADAVDAAAVARLQAELCALRIWEGLADTVRWARLYGGAAAVLLIDGQDPATPLRPRSVGRGGFRGLLALDRWQLCPDDARRIEDLGPDLGGPAFYRVLPGAPALEGAEIHHSRVLRLDGGALPHAQRRGEDGWGQSVVERLHDRLLAFDSASQGAAQLVFKAHLRTYKVEGLREIIAAGGPALDALIGQVDLIRRFQSNEGLTLLDAADGFETHQYGFSGLSDLIGQFGQQISGALGIPLVRLFGQSPAGLGSTGEADLRAYYDVIHQRQESQLRAPLGRILAVLAPSVLGRAWHDEGGERGEGGGALADFRFASPWQMDDAARAKIARDLTETVVAAHAAGLVDRAAARMQLARLSAVAGLWGGLGGDHETGRAP